MKYKFIDELSSQKIINLTESNKIDSFLLKNFSSEISDAVNFLGSEQKFLYMHGFLGVGKRQFINYITEALNKDVIKLEYFCKESTVSDDILLNFINTIEELPISKAVNINPKISVLLSKFKRYINSIKKPFLIILHTLDNVTSENISMLTANISEVLSEENVKIIITTKGIKQDLIPGVEQDTRIALKAFDINLFSEYLNHNSIHISGKILEDFYKYTRGYYFYIILSIKIMQAMKISPDEFIQRIKKAEISFDAYIGVTYINLIPKAIGNFFWFLKMLRHGISLNALAVLGIYDEFSLEYSKSNFILFLADETVYLHDYFIQELEILIPPKIEAKLHKYIIGIYEEQLKMPLKERLIMISRQALRAEIDYHNACISPNTSEKNIPEASSNIDSDSDNQARKNELKNDNTYTDTINNARQFVNEKKYTNAIEEYQKLIDTNSLDLAKLSEIRLELARIYYSIGEYMLSSRYYDLVEAYQIHKNESINLMYLYYEMSELYFDMYKIERAIDTIKKVIYSVNSPKTLVVKSCLLLGNIYADIKKTEEAYNYYKKGIDASDSDIESSILSELYFKFALANDDKEDLDLAFEYYNKCISIGNNNQFIAEAYSNLASCYYESANIDDALACLQSAYKIEKQRNNYEGIYYVSLELAKLYSDKSADLALKYLIEAKQSAEFINEEFYMTNAYIALGDFYYNDISQAKEALQEYFKAKSILKNSDEQMNILKIEKRIEDMKLRMDANDFLEIQNKYER